MAGKAVQVLLVTANVGSIFEDPSLMLKIWTEEFLQTVARLDPKFIAIHCQEVGGKNYERSMRHVEYFVRLLMTSEELRLFDKVRVYLDEDFSSAENFTALGNFYFIHETVADALIWDFAAMNFVSASGKEVHSGNIEAVTTKEKAKFPQDFFPECKWSRKGFLRTRWSLNGTVFDLINIHLFHDASNFLAMETFPSVYCKNRRRALQHTLERFHNDGYETAPFFVFGDFNFRTDTRGVVAKLSEGLNQVRVQSSKADQTRMQYQDENSQVVLSIGKKEFNHLQHQHIFTGDDGIWLKDFDRELESFSGSLFEFPITFPPSYPFEEDENGAKSYMKTRCPAWCDRVILANTATSLVNNLSDHSCVEYGIMGSGTCMGDHKPVYLKLELLTDAGTVCCCPPARGGVTYCLNGLSRSPVLDTLTLPRLPSYAHEPYTPESMDTPSPTPSPTPGDARELHRRFNACLTARLTANLQGDQGPLTQPSREADWTHCQSSEPPLDNDPPSPLHEQYSDFNANTTRLLCDHLKPLPQRPQVLVTQFAQINSDGLDLEQYFIKSLETEGFDLGLHTKGKTKMTEVPPNCLSSDSEMIDLQTKSGEEKKNKNINNRVSSQEILACSLKDSATGKTKKTLVKCLQSRSAVEMKVSSLEKMESVCALDPTGQGGMRTSRCLSDASWLQRGTVDNKSPSRVRLISGCESSTRLHSHHSSSDEDWFEEVAEPCRPREGAEPGEGAMTAPCRPTEVTEPGGGTMAVPCRLTEVTEHGGGTKAAPCRPPTRELPDVCALLHVDTDDEGPLPKGAAPLLPPLPDPHSGDTSAASLVAYFREQNAALSEEEEPGSEGHSDLEGGEKPGDGKCVFGCCTIL